MAVPVEMRVPAALVHLPSSSTTNKKRLPLVQQLFLLSPSVSERSSSSINSKLRRLNNPPSLLLHCIPGLIQMELEMTTTATEDEDAAAGTGILCDEVACNCNGKGWLICDFCRGQKTNVKASNNRLYRRCPSCKAIGYTLCPKCKVFKCVTFPNDLDNGDGSEVK